MRRTRAEWAAWVDEIAAGVSAAVISRREGLRHETLLWWKWRLGHERRAAVAAKKVSNTKPVKRALAPFLQVESLALHTAPTSHDVTIELLDLSLRVTVGTDPRYVAALVGALRAPC